MEISGFAFSIRAATSILTSLRYSDGDIPIIACIFRIIPSSDQPLLDSAAKSRWMAAWNKVWKNRYK